MVSTTATDSGAETHDATLDSTGETAVPIDAPSEAAADTGVALDGTSVDGDALGDGDTMLSDALGDGDGGDGGKVCHPALTTNTSTAACKPLIQSWEDEGHTHVLPTDPVSYCTRPPSSGDHYGDWANFVVYDKPVPYGNLVHSLEHGAVVMLYRCPTAMLPCKSTQNALVAIADAQPVDPICTAPLKRRIIVAPDPTLDVAIGAAAWQWTYRAECVDTTSLGDFVTAHYGKATEDLCAAGIDPTAM